MQGHIPRQLREQRARITIKLSDDHGGAYVIALPVIFVL
jgi:hypothetical protein